MPMPAYVRRWRWVHVRQRYGFAWRWRQQVQITLAGFGHVLVYNAETSKYPEPCAGWHPWRDAARQLWTKVKELMR